MTALTPKARDSLEAALALLTNGFADYAEAVLEACGDEALRPVLALLRQGAAPQATTQIREILTRAD